MAIAPRFTTTIGDVGSMAVVKAAPDTSKARIAAAYAKMGSDISDAASSIGKTAYDYGERVERKKEEDARRAEQVEEKRRVYMRSEVATWRSQVNAMKEAESAALRSESNPKKVIAFESKVDVNSFLKEKSATPEQIEEFNRTYEADRIAHEGRDNAYKLQVGNKVAIENTKQSIANYEVEYGRAVATNKQQEMARVQASIRSSLNDAAVLTGDTPDDIEREYQRSIGRSNYLALTEANAANAVPSTIADIHNRSGGFYGDEQAKAIAIVETAKINGKAGEWADANIVMRSDGNVDEAAMAKKLVALKRVVSEREFNAVDDAVRYRVNQNRLEVAAAYDNTIAAMNEIRSSGGSRELAAETITTSRDFKMLSPSQQSQIRELMQTPPGTRAKGYENRMEVARYNPGVRAKLMDDINAGRIYGSQANLDDMKIKIDQMYAADSTVEGKRLQAIHDKVSAKFSKSLEIDETGQYADQEAARRALVVIDGIKKQLPSDATNEQIDKAVSSAVTVSARTVEGLGTVNASLGTLAQGLADHHGISIEDITPYLSKAKGNDSQTKMINAARMAAEEKNRRKQVEQDDQDESGPGRAYPSFRPYPGM